jgi:hypothetical protein
MSQMDILLARIEFSPSLDGFVSPLLLHLYRLCLNFVHRAMRSNGISPLLDLVNSTWICSSSLRGPQTH